MEAEPDKTPEPDKKENISRPVNITIHGKSNKIFIDGKKTSSTKLLSDINVKIN